MVYFHGLVKTNKTRKLHKLDHFVILQAMCTKDRFCSRLDRDACQLIYNEKGFEGEVDPQSERDQQIFIGLLSSGLVELSRVGTRRAIHAWPFIKEIIIPARGQVHAALTTEGQMKLYTWVKGPEHEEGLEDEE